MPSDADLFQSEPPLAGSEIEALVGSLNRMRTYLLWKCGGLDAAGIRATLPPSTVTLGGLLKHLACFFKNPLGVEEHDFFKQMALLEEYVKSVNRQ